MDKVEYGYETIMSALSIINTIPVVGIENINKMHDVIKLLDSGTLKKIPEKDEEENNVRRIQKLEQGK